MGPLNPGGARAPRVRAGGFTLVEILVVAVIVGLLAGALALGLAPDERRLALREARRLAGALEHAAAAAQWRAETLGVSADGGGYRFWRRGADLRWSALADDDVLAPRLLPAGVTVVPSSYAGAPAPPDAIVPFRASGRNEPYALVLASAAWSIEIAADPLNRVRVAALAPSR